MFSTFFCGKISPPPLIRSNKGIQPFTAVLKLIFTGVCHLKKGLSGLSLDLPFSDFFCFQNAQNDTLILKMFAEK